LAGRDRARFHPTDSLAGAAALRPAYLGARLLATTALGSLAQPLPPASRLVTTLTVIANEMEEAQRVLDHTAASRLVVFCAPVISSAEFANEGEN